MSDLPDTDPGVPGIAEREDPPAAKPAVPQAEAEPGEPAAPQTPAGSAAPGDAGRTGSSGIADGVERSLDPRYIGLQRIIGGVVAAA
ncbi:MAG TPA: hypothetical protein VFP98_04210, partial [Candidatus Polarisedimenticolia bacterium]|nr:hypothetical protein [Candidatus Polarisedimenticolia bacterium]